MGTLKRDYFKVMQEVSKWIQYTSHSLCRIIWNKGIMKLVTSIRTEIKVLTPA